MHFLARSCVLRLYSIFFHSTHSQPKREYEPGCSGWKLSTITTTLRSLQLCNDKMPYLNQMYDKKAIAWLACTVQLQRRYKRTYSNGKKRKHGATEELCKHFGFSMLFHCINPNMALLLELVNLEITVHDQSRWSMVEWIECLHVNETVYLGSIPNRAKLRTIKCGIYSFAAWSSEFKDILRSLHRVW